MYKPILSSELQIKAAIAYFDTLASSQKFSDEAIRTLSPKIIRAQASLMKMMSMIICDDAKAYFNSSQEIEMANQVIEFTRNNIIQEREKEYPDEEVIDQLNIEAQEAVSIKVEAEKVKNELTNYLNLIDLKVLLCIELAADVAHNPNSQVYSKTDINQTLLFIFGEEVELPPMELPAASEHVLDQLDNDTSEIHKVANAYTKNENMPLLLDLYYTCLENNSSEEQVEDIMGAEAYYMATEALNQL